MPFLLLAAAGLGLSFAGADLLLDRGLAAPDGPALACPALGARVGSADRLELTHGGQVLWLERRGAVWGLARQGGYPAQPARADELVATLIGLRLLKPEPAPLDTLGLADPMQPAASSGTLIRVLATSGATLCAVVAGPNAAIRRPADQQAWAVNAPVLVPADAAGWSQHALPPLDPASIKAVTDDGGLGADVPPLLAAIPFTDVRPRPQAKLALVRTIALALADGTAIMAIGTEDGQAWLLVSGTSRWARVLAAYAFALPPGSKLAAS